MDDVDCRFQVTDEPRPGVDGGLAEMPLVTIAWRSLRAEQRQVLDSAKRAHAAARTLDEGLVKVALIAHRLGQLVDCSGDSQHELEPVVTGLMEALAGVGVGLLTPVGQPYSADLMGLLENVAQKPVPGATGPIVSEVLSPAVLRHGGLLRRGKVVIGLPPRRG